MTDLSQANFQLLQNTQKETFILKSVFAGARKSQLQGCSIRNKKEQFRKTSPGPAVKIFPRKLQGQ